MFVHDTAKTVLSSLQSARHGAWCAKKWHLQLLPQPLPSPSLPETVFSASTALLEGDGPISLFFHLSPFFPPQSLLTLAECPQVWPGSLPVLRLPGQRPPTLAQSLYQKPHPPCISRHARLLLPPVNGVIRGSCLNWEKGPRPAFTLPVGGGGGGGWRTYWLDPRILGIWQSAGVSTFSLFPARLIRARVYVPLHS